jgi:pyrroline-5-carboxylate reductase
MTEKTRFAIIGPGVMGEAIIAGLLRKELTTPAGVTAAGPRSARGDELKQHYHIHFAENAEAARKADVVILSVKPQRLAAVMKDLKGIIPEGALVISIIAGAKVAALQAGLAHRAVIRAMPNTPAQIGEGIAVWTAAPEVTAGQRELGGSILRALGEEVYVEDENYLDMATALSGTGPAYVFLFMEAMIDAGVHLGFPRRIAEQLVTQTLRGSVDYYSGRKQHAASLRNEVTSPGGTSAEALYYLEKAGFRTAISRAVWAAYERSQALGAGKDASKPD